MEVILKKTKITSSILKQIATASVIDLGSFEVLGFCIYKNRKWIILYKPSTNDLKKYLMFKEVAIEIDRSFFYVNVSFCTDHFSQLYKTADELESQKFVKLLNTIKKQAQTQGQFFI